MNHLILAWSSVLFYHLATAILWQYPPQKNETSSSSVLSRLKYPGHLLLKASIVATNRTVSLGSNVTVVTSSSSIAINVTTKPTPPKPRAMLHSHQCIVTDLFATIPHDLHFRGELRPNLPLTTFRESRLSDQPGKIECLSATIPAYSDFTRPSTELMERSGFDPYEVIEISWNEQYVDCPEIMVDTEICQEHLMYRTYDGFCNNLVSPSWGNRTQTYFRITPITYTDGQDTPRLFSVTDRNIPLPNARAISTTISQSIPIQHPVSNLLVPTFGQFIAHDFALTPTYQVNNKQPDCCVVNSQCTVPECFQFSISPFDPLYSRFNITCHQFARSLPSLLERCRTGIREQFTTVSHWLDLSPLYGSSERQNTAIRTFLKGRLSWRDVDNGEEDNPETPIYKQILPSMLDEGMSTCQALDERRTCFLAGDERVNQQPMLVTLHTIFLRYHNIIAGIFAWNFPMWTDEMIFQESRKLVVAVYQTIVYKEFLPVLMGRDSNGAAEGDHSLQLVKNGYFHGYDASYDPHVSNEFTTAAFRLHTLLDDHVPRLLFVTGTIEHNFLTTQLNNQTLVYEEGNIDAVLSGMLEQFAQAFDRQSTLEIQGLLFRGKMPFGLDLIAIDIQRGRDHGLGTYNDLREACGYGRAVTFGDLSDLIPVENVRILEDIYRDVDDIDMAVGGLMERPVTPTASVGTTSACVIALEFHGKRVADRFWFENPHQFSLAQLDQLRKVTMAEVICMTTALRNVPENAFSIASEKNPLKPCQLFQELDLSLFSPGPIETEPVLGDPDPRPPKDPEFDHQYHEHFQILNDLDRPMPRESRRGR